MPDRLTVPSRVFTLASSMRATPPEIVDLTCAPSIGTVAGASSASRKNWPVFRLLSKAARLMPVMAPAPKRAVKDPSARSMRLDQSSPGRAG